MEQATAAADIDPTAASPVVNDVVISVATSNGSGSQSSNLILMRAIFGMGVPVSGKNLFPSNIQGLPTWYTLRANKHGWLAQRNNPDIVVAMNPESIQDDIRNTPEGAILVLPDSLAAFVKRDDITVVAAPFAKLVNAVCEDTRLRPKVVNVVYVGVVAWLLHMDLSAIEDAVKHQFGKKQKAIDLNMAAARAGYEWASEHVEAKSPFAIQPCEAAKGKILIEGNEATAIGMTFGGATVASWYPITPSSSVCEYLTQYMKKFRTRPDGTASYAILQAEDELAAIGAVLGASWAGARAFTATSGPGVSLMAEMAGLAYFAEIPAVIVDVQRMGPSTGLPTRTSQGDVLKAYNLSHGDCRHVALLPGSPNECYEFAMESLNLAERLQTLVFLLTDLDLGMNKWLQDEFQPPAQPIDRGKVLDAEQLEKTADWGRYKDVDGDGIPYRTLPGTPHPRGAYFTRGTGHTEYAGYTEDSGAWQANIDRLARKFDTARGLVPQPIADEPGSSIGVIAYGSTDLAMQEARAMLRDKHEFETDYLRVRALPVSNAVREFIERHDQVLVVEQNRDGQLCCILQQEYPDLAPRLKKVLHYNGIPVDAATLAGGILRAAEAIEV